MRRLSVWTCSGRTSETPSSSGRGRRAGAVGVDVLGPYVGDLEQQRGAAVELGLDQVLGHLGLAVHPHRSRAQLREVELVPGARVLQVDAAVLHALALQPVADSGRG